MPTPTLTNVITGGATIYTGAASLAMPASTVVLGAAWPAGWTYAGGTDSGLVFGIAKNTQDRTIDEQSTPVNVDTLSTDVTVAVTLAEDTIENIKLSAGSGTLVVNAGATPPNKVFTLDDPLNTFAVGFEGKNGFGLARRVYLPIAIISGQVAVPYQRVASKRMYAVTFRAICPPTSITVTDVTT
jgi:hypothetical protein